MKLLKYIIYCITPLLILISCGKKSMDDDARKAAELSNLSTQRALTSDWTAADKYYRESQTIIDKYRPTPEFQDFFDLYNTYLEVAAYDQMQPLLEEDTKK